jgi:large subunit ribosomal protein L22
MSKKEVTVKSKYNRISPKKVRPILSGFKGLSLSQGQQRCQQINNKASRIISKLIKSAQSAALDKDLDEDKVVIEKLVCQTGPTMKRQLIRSRGRADVIRKRSSHLFLTIEAKREKNKASKSKK